MVNVLVVHALRFGSRLTTVLHATCFARYLHGAHVTFTSTFGNHSGLLDSARFDVGIVTYEALGLRSGPEWKAVSTRIRDLLSLCDVKIAMPQDDYTKSALLDEFMVEAGIDWVWTPIVNDLQHLYPRSMSLGISFREALTGYWDPFLKEKTQRFARDFPQRQWDVGTRVRSLLPYLGSLASRKAELSLEFANQAATRGFNCNVSTGDRDVLLGDDWLRFLGDCRFTIGRKGGASLADSNGKMARRANILKACFPRISYSRLGLLCGATGRSEHDFSAISPRLFEAAAMGVCQILEEDSYLEGMKPWVHFLPLAHDLSNIEAIFLKMSDHRSCEQIAENARRLLIDSDEFSYSTFVRSMMHQIGFSLTDSDRQVSVIDIDHGASAEDPASLLEVQRNARRLMLGRVSLASKSGSIEADWVREVKDGSRLVESVITPSWCSMTSAFREI